MSRGSRIKELRQVPAGSLKPHPLNWRRHSTRQRSAVHALLVELGHVNALVVRELDNGELQLIDGHLRAGLDPREVVPVLVVDLDDDEALEALATLDPLAGMAAADHGALDSLQAEIVEDAAHLKHLFKAVNRFHPLEVGELNHSAEEVRVVEEILVDRIERVREPEEVECPSCGESFEVLRAQ